MKRPRFSRRIGLALALLTVSVCSVVSAQTTSAPGIDVEIYNPVDGSNSFCAVPNVAFWAHVFVRPGDENLTCDRTCGNNIPGGSASVATALIDVGFETSVLSVQNCQSNPDPTYAAVDGIPQLQNLDTGRIGWALEGDWIVDGNPSSGFNDPCVMQKLQSEGWVFRVQFTAASEGSTSLHLRSQVDPAPFALSFADICGSEAFTVSNGVIDEVVDAIVTVSWACCSYDVDPTSAAYGPLGGSGSVIVNTQGDCPWNAASNVGWATVTSGSPGMGSGTVTYDVSANSSPDPRTGTLTVAGQAFTVHQEGLGPDVFADGFESGDTSQWSATVP